MALSAFRRASRAFTSKCRFRTLARYQTSKKTPTIGTAPSIDGSIAYHLAQQPRIGAELIGPADISDAEGRGRDVTGNGDQADDGIPAEVYAREGNAIPRIEPEARLLQSLEETLVVFERRTAEVGDFSAHSGQSNP